MADAVCARTLQMQPNFYLLFCESIGYIRKDGLYLFDKRAYVFIQ